MKTLRLGDVNLLDFGNTIQLCGTVWSGNGLCFVTLVPEKQEDFSDLAIMPLTLEEWQTLLRQTDLLETEILANDPGGIKKVIYRKSQRQIDSYLQWACFKRDGYRCQYCYREVPLTVDHVILFEEFGATVAENLVSACKSCNKDRGRIQYADWINSDLYKQKSVSLPDDIKQKNIDRINQLDYLKTLNTTNTRSR